MYCFRSGTVKLLPRSLTRMQSPYHRTEARDTGDHADLDFTTCPLILLFACHDATSVLRPPITNPIFAADCAIHNGMILLTVHPNTSSTHTH